MVDFWVQIYGLPSNRINEENVYKVGQSLGKVKAMDFQCSPEFNKSVARVRVRMDSKERLMKGIDLRIELGEIFPVTFKYEKLDIFCYFCGCIGHDIHYCYQCEKYSMNMRKHGGSPRDMPSRNRGSPVKRNWNGTGILATPPRRRTHVEQSTDNNTVTAEKIVRGLAVNRTALFEKDVSVTVVGYGQGGPIINKSGHGPDLQGPTQEARAGHMGFTSMRGPSEGALVIWSPDSFESGMNVDEVMGKKNGLAFMLRKLGLNIKAPVASFTGGLVGDSSPFLVLPQSLIHFVLNGQIIYVVFNGDSIDNIHISASCIVSISH
ncbi:hypothetical protein IFM89_005254 [Coptis chinensis]|uniref:Zinc knuckle CX2CX4HX4C domain-containing protein n=1 Tax=Coptis chinensis TaxID=261450 RepID=A0A835IWX3_9MAGN|nr:hypothetical protein IFM89_005254 [Coptis chinensis]